MKTTEAHSRTDVDPPADRGLEKRIVEALIFISDVPITVEQVGQVLPGRTPDDLLALIEELESDLRDSGRGLRIEEVAGGFRFATRSELAPWIRVHFRNRNRARLSPASIETLAVIAYKQPVTAPEIHEIRGVDSQASIKTLLEKRLVRIAGRKKVVGRPFLYATSRDFLMHFGLASIEDLPPIEDFEQFVEGIGPGSSELAPDAPVSTLAALEGDRGEEDQGGVSVGRAAREGEDVSGEDE